jgi:hypothetical protein
MNNGPETALTSDRVESVGIAQLTFVVSHLGRHLPRSCNDDSVAARLDRTEHAHE